MGSTREVRIDFIRGLSLLAIFIGHAGFDFSDAFQHSRGFSDASELFVVLAGMSAALAYYRPAAKGGEAMARRTLPRAARLYVIHVAMVAAVVAVSLTPWLAARPAILDAFGLASFWDAPLRHAFEVVVLSYMPGDLDILPLYVFLLVATPFLILVHERSRPLLLGGSLALALVVGGLRFDLVNEAMPNRGWYFDPLSWQVVFVIGLMLGIRLKTSGDPLPYRHWPFRIAAALALAAVPANLLLHFVYIDLGDSRLVHALTSKTFVGPVRLVNALALLYVVWNLGWVRRLRPEGVLGPLFAAGRASLPVFCFGIALSMACVAAMNSGVPVPATAQVSLAVAGCLAQLLLALRFQAREKRQSAARSAAAATAAAREAVVSDAARLRNERTENGIVAM